MLLGNHLLRFTQDAQEVQVLHHGEDEGKSPSPCVPLAGVRHIRTAHMVHILQKDRLVTPCCRDIDVWQLFHRPPLTLPYLRSQ